MDATGISRGGFSDIFPASASPGEPALRTQ
jgi:hypothetical protein